MKTKATFQVLDEMNREDLVKKTRLVAVSNNIMKMEKNSRGVLITMGADHQTFDDISSKKYIPLLVIVDHEEYLRRADEEVVDELPKKSIEFFQEQINDLLKENEKLQKQVKRLTIEPDERQSSPS